jgi:hypothetical protein
MGNNVLDEGLMQRMELFDAVLAPLGGFAMRKRYAVVDYRKDGADMHECTAIYQDCTMNDASLVLDIVDRYREQGKSVSAITEINDQGDFKGVLYANPALVRQWAREGLLKER